MTHSIDERLDRLTGVVESLAARIVERKGRIEKLIKAAEEHLEGMARSKR